MKIQHNQDGDFLLPPPKKVDRKSRTSKNANEQINENFLRLNKDYTFRAVSKEYSDNKINDINDEQYNYNIINFFVIEILERINCRYEDFFSYSLNLCKKNLPNKEDIDDILQMSYLLNKTIVSKELIFMKYIDLDVVRI